MALIEKCEQSAAGEAHRGGNGMVSILLHMASGERAALEGQQTNREG